LRVKGFNVYEIERVNFVVRSYNRKEFYKICMDTGRNIVHYAQRSFDITGLSFDPFKKYFFKLNNTELIKLLKTFSLHEFLEFGKFVNSPIHYEGQKMISLRNSLRCFYPDFNSKGFSGTDKIIDEQQSLQKLKACCDFLLSPNLFSGDGV
jgi:hypothetical protein